MTQAPSISTLDFTNNYTYAGWANTLDLFEKSFDVPSIDLGPLTGSASADIGLQAILDATSGTAAINYPVDVQVSTPNTIEPGANIDIITSFAGGQTAQAFLQTQSPNLTAAIDATASADIAAQIQGFGFSVPVDASFGGTNPILELNTSLPTYDLSLGALSLEVNLPQPFTGKGGILNETGVTMPPLQAFGTGDFLTATADLPSLINDILDATGIGVAIPPLSGTIGFGIGSLAYNILTADLTGSLAIGEQTTFTPTALDLTLTPNFGGQAETEPVGSGFVFHVPSGWNQPVVLTPTYSLSGILTTQYGLAGSAALDLSALSLQVVSLGGTLQLGPAFDQTYPLVPSSFLPLLTLPTTTLDLSAGSAVLPGYTIDVQSSSHPTPTWTALTASPETGDIVTGGTILFTLDLSAPATVSGGTPELVLNDGGTATYDAAASVASDLVFNYTVQSGQSTDALSVSTLDLNGASIAGAGGNADLSNVAQNFPNLEVNALPSVTGIGVSATYTAGAAAAALDPGLKVTDPSSADLTGAIVQISSGVLAGDRLNFVDQNGIVGEVFIFNGATDELTLSGTASLADYQTALDSVTYSSTAADPTANGTDTSRTITWMVSDANGSSKLATSTIDVQLQPQPGPTLTVLTVSPYATADITTGQSITFTLRMSASVTVSGTPELILNDGGTAAYDAAASGGSDMVFDYTVQSGQSADVLAVSTIDLNGAGVIGAGGSANFPNAPFETFANLAVNVPQNINITWSNGTNGNWATSTDWSPIVIPGSTDNVIIEAGTVVINNGDNPFCKNLTLGSDATLTITQGSVLSISGGGDVNNAGVISVDQNSDLLANEDLTLTGGGSISLSGNSSVLSNGRATLTNYNNTISGAGAIDTFNFINGAGGLVEANVSGGALVLDPGNYSFVNDGEFVAHHGLLIVDIPVTGAGAATIEAAGTIDLRANDGQDVSFNGVGGVLDLGVPGEFSGIISGFVTGDTIVLTNDAYTSADQVSLGANNALTVAGANGPLASLQFNPSGSYSASDFSLVNAGGDVGIVNGSTAQSAPTLTALTASPDTGDITTGHSIAFTLDLSAPATVSGGTPDLILNDGGTATYAAAASGTQDLGFDYTVQSGQSTEARPSVPMIVRQTARAGLGSG